MQVALEMPSWGTRLLIMSQSKRSKQEWSCWKMQAVYSRSLPAIQNTTDTRLNWRRKLTLPRAQAIQPVANKWLWLGLYIQEQRLMYNVVQLSSAEKITSTKHFSTSPAAKSAGITKENLSRASRHVLHWEHSWKKENRVRKSPTPATHLSYIIQIQTKNWIWRGDTFCV